MKTQGTKKALILSERDRVMEQFKKKLSVMKRIRKTGPRNQAEIIIVKNCISFTIGEINRHNMDYEKYQESGKAEDNS